MDPLYQTLSAKIKTQNMTQKQMTELSEKLKTSNHLAIGRLIVEHYYQEGGSLAVEDPKIPYRGVHKNGNTTFDVKELPSKLRWILWKFVNLS
jgi:hypothetical protein